jgi:hypothetical protein
MLLENVVKWATDTLLKGLEVESEVRILPPRSDGLVGI